MVSAEHPNPDIATLAIKIITELAEDRELNDQDILVKIID